MYKWFKKKKFKTHPLGITDVYNILEIITMNLMLKIFFIVCKTLKVICVYDQ